MLTLLIAGTQSGCGKTTVTLALMQYLRGKNITIAPFKAGPDFLDPMWHSVACERTSYNLDTRMLGAERSRQLLAEKSVGADISIIEGVMGLFDGATGVGGEGSSAHLAQTLDMPVLLVVSAKGMSGSIVPLVEGFVARAKAMDVQIVGIVANHVGSANHAKILRALLLEFDLPPLLAWLNKAAPQLSERHLGLKMPSEGDFPDFSTCLHVEKDVFSENMQKTACFAATNRKSVLQNGKLNKSQTLKGKNIAIAKDAAFCFVYAANMEWLRAQGASVDFFSPLRGEAVPQGADALWLPGGYPELHLEALRVSPSLPSLAAFVEADQPVLAECGGMMVLGEDIDGVSMASVLPCSFAMQDRLAGLGYREDVSGVRGHEFHHSKRECHHDVNPCFVVPRGDAGVQYKKLRASYIHWYFASQPDVVAAWFGG